MLGGGEISEAGHDLLWSKYIEELKDPQKDFFFALKCQCLLMIDQMQKDRQVGGVSINQKCLNQYFNRAAHAGFTCVLCFLDADKETT